MRFPPTGAASLDARRTRPHRSPMAVVSSRAEADSTGKKRRGRRSRSWPDVPADPADADQKIQRDADQRQESDAEHPGKGR